MGSVVVLQCQQNIANVPQASTNSLLPHPRCATVSTPSSSSDDKSRAGSKERNNRENGGSVASSSIFIHHILWKWSSLQNLLNFLITRRIDYHSSSKYISIHSSISLKKLESGESEERLSIVRKFNSSCFLHNFCLKFPSAKSNIHRSLFSILVHLADLLWKFYTKIGLDSFNNSIDDNFLNYRSFS